MNSQSTPLSVPLLSAWFSCVLSTCQTRIEPYLPQMQIKERQDWKIPCSMASQETPSPNAFDLYCMGHHLCWHCLGPLSQLLPESYSHRPHSMGVYRNTILPRIDTKPIAKASPTFFSYCRHNSDAPKIVYAYKQTPTIARSLLCFSSGLI